TFKVKLKVITDAGCPDSLTLNSGVVVKNNSAAFTASPAFVCIDHNDTVIFTGPAPVVGGPAIKKYEWTFGSNSKVLNGKVARWFFPSVGKDTVTLKVMYADGCTTSTTQFF